MHSSILLGIRKQEKGSMVDATDTDRLLLNGVWEFTPGADGNPPLTGWLPMRVPHRSREFEEDPPESGWYRTTLRIPADWDVKGLGLDLERVRHYGRLYLDGEVVGDHHHMRLPWRVDLSALLRPGHDHELLIYTHNCTGSYAHRDFDVVGESTQQALDTLFWFTSPPTVGVESDVWLTRRLAVRIEDVHVITSVRDHRIRVEAKVINETSASIKQTLNCRVERDGELKLSLPPYQIDVEPESTQDIVLAAPWEDPVLWGRPPYGEPLLYFLRATMGNLESTTRFGFREIWAEGDQLLLNGHKLMPWGDHTLPYVYERQWLTRKFQDLAEANISIIEHHRYDPPQVLYDVADEMGVFVVGANFCVGTGQVPRGETTEAEKALIMATHLAVADNWIRRSRNHPSILFWDVTDARDPDFCVPLLRKVKELDQTRIAEVTFEPYTADDELIGLIDCYRLFSSLETIQEAVEVIRAELPVKPIRVGEAGIFAGPEWGHDEAPPLMEGWEEFLQQIPNLNLHGLQTFHLADMDYSVFSRRVPGMLSGGLDIDIHWPSQSGADARIDPLGEGTPKAWGKAAILLNWCDPSQPISKPTATSRWSRDLFRRWTGRDVGPLNEVRTPEILVEVIREGTPVSGAQVFVRAMDEQGLSPFGVQADEAGTSWFVLPEQGRYRFECGDMWIEVEAICQPLVALPGYDHVQRERLELC
jgi:hypothetical protein